MPCPSIPSKHFLMCSKNFGCVEKFWRVQKFFDHVQNFWVHIFLQILSISSIFAPHSNFLDMSKKFWTRPKVFWPHSKFFDCVQKFWTEQMDRALDKTMISIINKQFIPEKYQHLSSKGTSEIAKAIQFNIRTCTTFSKNRNN